MLSIYHLRSRARRRDRPLQSEAIRGHQEAINETHLRRRERRRDRPLQMDHLRDVLLLLCRDGAIEPSPQLGHLMRDAIKGHQAQSRVRAPPTAINLMRDAIKGPLSSQSRSPPTAAPALEPAPQLHGLRALRRRAPPSPPPPARRVGRPPRSSAEIASPRARPASPDELQSRPGDSAPPWPRARAAPISPARDCGSSPRAPPREIGARIRQPRAPASYASSAPATKRGAIRAQSGRNRCTIRAQSGVISHLLVLHQLETSFVGADRHLLHLLTRLPK